MIKVDLNTCIEFKQNDNCFIYIKEQELWEVVNNIKCKQHRIQGTTPVIGHNWRIRMNDERYIVTHN